MRKRISFMLDCIFLPLMIFTILYLPVYFDYAIIAFVLSGIITLLYLFHLINRIDLEKHKEKS